MVWKTDEKLDEDKKPGEENTATQGQVLSSPSAGGSSAGQSAAGTAAKDKTSSGSFTNLQSYIGANTGADKAMVGRVGNTVSNAQNTATDAGNTLNVKADDTVAAGTVTDTKGVTNTFKETSSVAAPVTPQAPPTVAPAPPVVADPDTTLMSTPIQKTVNDFAVDDVSKLWNAEYTGPNSWNDKQLAPEAEAATSAYNKVADYGSKAGGDISDRGVLLDDTFATAGQQYNKGERMLDSYLLGAGSEAGTLQGIADTASNYGSEFDALKKYIGNTNDAESLIGKGKVTTDKTRTDVREAGTGAQGRLETEFKTIMDKGGSLEQKVAQEQAIIDAAMSKDPTALKQFGFSDKAISELIRNSSLGAEQLKNLISGSVDYKLGDVANESDTGTYSQLMKLLTGSDKEGKVTQNYTDFEKGKGTTLTSKEGANAALEELADLESSNAAELAALNTANAAKFARAEQLLSRIGSEYSATPLNANEIAELAGTLGVSDAQIKNAVEQGDPLELNKILSQGQKATIGNVMSPEEVAQYQKLEAFLKTPGKNLNAADTKTTLDTSGEQFADYVPPTAQEAINQANTEKTPESYRKAYEVVVAGWPPETRSLFPEHVFTVLATKLGDQIGTAISGLMDAVKAAGMAGSDAAKFIASTATTLTQSPNAAAVQEDLNNAIAAAKKTGAVAGSSTGKVASTFQQPINTIFGR